VESSLRIYVVIACFLPLVGGSEKQCLAQCRCLRERGYQITIITFHHDQAWLRDEVIEGVPVIRIAGALLGRREKLSRFFQRLLYLLALMAMSVTLWRHRDRYDLIHVFNLGLFALPSALACRLAGKPLIIAVQGASAAKGKTGHSSSSLIAGPLDPETPWLQVQGRTRVGGDLESLERLGKLAVRCTRALLRSVHAVVVVLSSRMKDYLVTHDFTLLDVQLIPNGVDITRFMPTNADNPLAELAQVVVCVSRLSYEKGIDVLLQAWHIVHEQAPQARLIIVGIGPLQPQLGRLAAALDIAESVEFAGLHHDVVTQLQRGGVAILPSRIEGMPNALLEAMACGLACVATRVSGSEDIIQHEINGLLVESEDYQSMAKALLRLLRDPALAQRYGQAARSTVEQRYSLEFVADTYVELYQRVARRLTMTSAQEKTENREYKAV
jgi:glycosyltransferase involved in cell wall biosynthesis